MIQTLVLSAVSLKKQTKSRRTVSQDASPNLPGLLDSSRQTDQIGSQTSHSITTING